MAKKSEEKDKYFNLINKDMISADTIFIDSTLLNKADAHSSMDTIIKATIMLSNRIDKHSKDESYYWFLVTKYSAILLSAASTFANYSNRTSESLVCEAINNLQPKIELKLSTVRQLNSINNWLLKLDKSKIDFVIQVMNSAQVSKTRSLFRVLRILYWMDNNNVLDGIDINSCEYARTDTDIIDLIKNNSTTEIVCSTCKSKYPVHMMRLEHSVCLECERIQQMKKRYGKDWISHYENCNTTVKVNLKRKKEKQKKKQKDIAVSLESKIKNYKSGKVVECNHSKEFSKAELIIETINNNLYDLQSIDSGNFSDNEKETLKNSINNIIKSFDDIIDYYD